MKSGQKTAPKMADSLIAWIAGSSTREDSEDAEALLD
jgi:hypothetical protein